MPLTSVLVKVVVDSQEAAEMCRCVDDRLDYTGVSLFHIEVLC